jgi:hypothetical protein
MQCTVLDHYTNKQQIFEGSDAEVRLELYENFPWLLAIEYDGNVQSLVQILDRSQQYSAIISSVELEKKEETFYSYQAKDIDLLTEAAEFLSGVKVDDCKYRAELLARDGDEKAALLACCGLEPTKENLKALGAVVCNLNKSEDKYEPVHFKEVIAANESGMEFAKAVKRASDADRIRRINLGAGKHSKGTLVARDPESKAHILLKPGHGKQNPALGEEQNPATQSQREAAFYAVASAWGIGKFVPECYLLFLDGEECAAMTFLAYQWTNGGDLKEKEKDPNLARRILSMYAASGELYKWAVLDYVLGNPDRHSGNVMFRQGEVRLIDHGSALAGIDFRPAQDKYSFIPYYIRAVAPGDFDKLSPAQKLLSLPRLYTPINEEFGKWIQGLSEEPLSKLLIISGIDPLPSLARLDTIKEAAKIQSPDMAIITTWVVG